MTPDYKIIANGKDITGTLDPRLISLDLTDKAGSKSDRLTLVLDDRDQVLEMPDKGAKLEVSLGFVETGIEPMGSYIVDDVEVASPPRRMSIRASAADFTKGVKAPKERSWHDTTLDKVARQIAGEHGLTPKIDKQFGSIKIEHEDQTESDMNFLARLCMGIGCVFKVANGNMIIAENYSGKSVSGKQVETIAIADSECSSWSANLTSRAKYGKAKAKWYDPEKGGELSYEEEEDGEGETMVVSKTYRDKETAKNAAKSALAANKSSTGTLSIRGLTGNPRLSAESKLQLSGFRVGIDELEWFVETVRHSLSKSGGYICDISAEIKGNSGASGSSSGSAQKEASTRSTIETLSDIAGSISYLGSAKTRDRRYVDTCIAVGQRLALAVDNTDSSREKEQYSALYTAIEKMAEYSQSDIDRGAARINAQNIKVQINKQIAELEGKK